jgi:phage N-6-adenine-methyltransferase
VVTSTIPRDIVETPWPFFRRLDAEFNFTLDVCALPSNAKCARYFTPEMNGLAQRWEGVCWMNPPYFQGRIGAWLAKAFHEVQENDCVVVAFVHSAFDTAWWHEYVLRAAEIRFVRGRLAGCGRAAIVVFRHGKRVPKTSTISANG